MSHQITLKQAIELTTTYQKEKNQILKAEYANTNMLPVSETFHKSAFEELINQPGCVKIKSLFWHGFRIRKCDLVFVGEDKNDEDLLPPANAQ